MAVSYPMPSWLGPQTQNAQLMLEGTRTGAGIAQDNAANAAKSNLAQVGTNIDLGKMAVDIQNTSNQAVQKLGMFQDQMSMDWEKTQMEALMKQQEIDVGLAYKEQQMRQQQEQLDMQQQEHQQRIQQAGRMFQAQQAINDSIQQGMDPTMAYQRFGPMAFGNASGIAPMMRNEMLASQFPQQLAERQNIADSRIQIGYDQLNQQARLAQEKLDQQRELQMFMLNSRKEELEAKDKSSLRAVMESELQNSLAIKSKYMGLGTEEVDANIARLREELGIAPGQVKSTATSGTKKDPLKIRQ